MDIPREKFTVITGVSGSGKSTLAFDILFAEGQRRYLESLNAYARQFVQPAARPDVDAIFGIPPTVAIEQRTSRGGSKSTVATLTELYHFLRLLYVKLGTQFCPTCDVPIEPQSFESIAARLLRDYRGQHIGLLAPLVVNRKGYYTDLAKWAAGKGFSHLRVDGEFLPTGKWPRLSRFQEHTIELPVADLRVAADTESELREALTPRAGFRQGCGARGLAPGWPDGRQGRGERGGALHQARLPVLRHQLPGAGPAAVLLQLQARLVRELFRHRPADRAGGLGRGAREDRHRGPGARFLGRVAGARRAVPGVRRQAPEPDRAARALPGALHRRPDGAARRRGRAVLRELALAGREGEIARDMLAELRARLSFLQEVGLGYLALDRSAPTLSGGEAQRIRLASQLGSNLRGVCYILDEPTIGLHPRDNRILLDTLAKLEAKGNTLVVVEHDEDTIRRAEHVIDLGPGAGTRGGHIVAQGSAEELIANPASLTGRFLAQPLRHPLQPRRAVSRSHAVDRSARRRAAQSQERGCAHSARPSHRDHRRVRQRQEHARARRALRQPAGAAGGAAPQG